MTKRNDNWKVYYDEGVEAASAGIGFDQCPYTWDHVRCKSHEFDELFRPKLNAWFNGWQEARRAQPGQEPQS